MTVLVIENKQVWLAFCKLKSQILKKEDEEEEPFEWSSCRTVL